MQNTKKTATFSLKLLGKKACAGILLIAMLMQMLAVPGFALQDLGFSLWEDEQGQSSPPM